MLLIALLSLLTFLSATNPSKCTAQLQNVLADPSTFSKGYLARISAQLNAYSRLLFTSQASSIVANFEQEYGVTVSLQNPMSPCPGAASPVSTCKVFTDTFDTPDLQENFTINVDLPGLVTSVSLTNFTGTISTSKSTFLEGFPLANLTLYSPNGKAVNILQQLCESTQGTDFAFSLTDSLSTPFDCALYDSGLGFQPTNSFSGFVGESATGNWTLESFSAQGLFMDELSLTVCAAEPVTCSLTSDLARAGLNVPGYRYDATVGVAYFTSVVRDCQGQMLYSTISRSVANMIIKK